MTDSTLLNLTTKFLRTLETDQHDVEDWPTDSKEALEELSKFVNQNETEERQRQLSQRHLSKLG